MRLFELFQAHSLLAIRGSSKKLVCFHKNIPLFFTFLISLVVLVRILWPDHRSSHYRRQSLCACERLHVHYVFVYKSAVLVSSYFVLVVLGARLVGKCHRSAMTHQRLNFQRLMSKFIVAISKESVKLSINWVVDRWQIYLTDL